MSVASFLIAFSGPATTCALDPSTALANYARQAWVMENGLPQNTVTAVIQSRDGFVWLGTEAGLVRFDGNSFRLFDRNASPALPDNDICCLLEATDGSMWIGTSGGLGRLLNGQIRAYSTRDGLPGNGIRGLALASDGQLWVNTDEGIVRLNGDKFLLPGKSAGQNKVLAATASGGSSFWMETTQRDESASVSWKHNIEQAGLAQDLVEFGAALSSGQMAIASKSLLLVMRGDDVFERLSMGKDLPGTRIQSLAADREGSLWIGTNGGLVRWAAGKLESLPVTDPLATASVLALMEDREGNIWVGTEADGLHILRDQRFHMLGARDGLASDATTAVVEDRGGTLWVGTQDAGLSAFTRMTRVKSRPERGLLREGLLSDVILSLAAAPHGDIWVGTPDGLNRFTASEIDASLRPTACLTILSVRCSSTPTARCGSEHGEGLRTGNPPGGQAARLRNSEATLRKPTDWAATLLAPWRAVKAAICGWRRWRAVSPACRLHFQLHDRRWTFQQRGDGASGSRRWNSADRDPGSRMGCLGWQGFFAVGGDLESTTIHAILDDTEDHLGSPPAMASRAASEKLPAIAGVRCRAGLSSARPTDCAAANRGQQPPLRMAFARWASLVRLPEGWWKWIRRTSRSTHCSARGAGAVCRRRCGSAAASARTLVEGCRRTCAL